MDVLLYPRIISRYVKYLDLMTQFAVTVVNVVLRESWFMADG